VPFHLIDGEDVIGIVLGFQVENQRRVTDRPQRRRRTVPEWRVSIR
jgi:hypothetical protein